jgi:hypothetical protein
LLHFCQAFSSFAPLLFFTFASLSPHFRYREHPYCYCPLSTMNKFSRDNLGPEPFDVDATKIGISKSGESGGRLRRKLSQ